MRNSAKSLRYAAQGERVAAHNFCRGLVTTAVSAALELAIEVALAPAVPRRPGRPRGSLNVEIFIRGLLKKMVDIACATVATTTKQTYRKRRESEKDMALHIAHEKASDSRAVSFFATTFPNTRTCGKHQTKKLKIPGTPAEAKKGRNWDAGTYGKN